MPQIKLRDIIKNYPEISGIHEACLAVPEISDDDFKALSESIKSTGLRHEIILTKEGMLVDGRNRLIACYIGQVEPRFRHVSTDPWQVAFDENIARRHLTTYAKCAFASAWREHESQLAKQRQSTLNGRTQLKETFPEAKGQTRDIIGEKVGVSGKSMDKFRDIQEHAPPDVKEKAATGEVSLEFAFKEAKKVKAEKVAVPFETKEEKKSEDTVEIVTAVGIVSRIKAPKTVRFNQTNDSVDWAAWTWNPVTGCEHGCKFCYAREIANSERMKDYYPNGFEPTFHSYRLAAPKNTPVPEGATGRDGRVFVCSMADLFGKWVPDSWIQKVFDVCLDSPDWEYLFLTKWPKRYSQMPLLEKAWYGASIIQQSDVARVEKAMSDFKTDCVKWISLEPMLEPITFSDLSWCSLVVIGAQTSTTQPEGFVPSFSPEFDWVVDVVNQCRDFGVPYYIKANLGLDAPGMKLPKMQPRRIACTETTKSI